MGKAECFTAFACADNSVGRGYPLVAVFYWAALFSHVSMIYL
jgi:hypothetical protein